MIILAIKKERTTAKHTLLGKMTSMTGVLPLAKVSNFSKAFAHTASPDPVASMMTSVQHHTRLAYKTKIKPLSPFLGLEVTNQPHPKKHVLKRVFSRITKWPQQFLNKGEKVKATTRVKVRISGLSEIRIYPDHFCNRKPMPQIRIPEFSFFGGMNTILEHFFVTKV